ncbi:AbrB/MazE/SpoVT family DNA-binding domain-containing protein [Candidatus Pacearchaeota archaeon]|nr:AbrB/MazE/SpoVT family DNA-binding domain-containing protein [Candidatus Pacearchaeota archaeon]
MTIGMTKLSSRGQIVIPQEMRKNFNEGDNFIVVIENNKIILTNESDVEASILEDLEFENRTREAEKRMDTGEYVEVELDTLEEEMNKW